MRVRRLVKWISLVLPLLLVAAFAIAWWRSDNECSGPARPAPSTPMRAVMHCDYGPPDVLTLGTVEKPVPLDTQLLVRVKAASVNPVDWHSIRGTPYVMRLDSGLRKPADTRVGVDFAGVVEAVGRQVTRFKVGDEVFGGRNGALAEYIVVTADRAVAHKPANVTFEQAAAVAVAGLTALQAVRDRGQTRQGTTRVDQRRVRRRRHVRGADRQDTWARKSPACAARATSRWSARSGPTTSSTTRKRTSRPGRARTT